MKDLNNLAQEAETRHNNLLTLSVASVKSFLFHLSLFCMKAKSLLISFSSIQHSIRDYVPTDSRQTLWASFSGV